MRKSIVVTEDNYKEIVLKRAIITCWVLLAICLIIKIFGGNFFNIMTTNQTFKNFCKYADSGIVYYIIAFIFYFFGNYMFIQAIISKIKMNRVENVLTISFIITCYGLKFTNTIVSFIADLVIYMIILPIILLRRNNFNWKLITLRIIIGIITVNLFQLLSMFIKNIAIFKVMENNSLIQIIFSIDYYFMMILYVLYSRKIYLKKEV